VVGGGGEEGEWGGGEEEGELVLSRVCGTLITPQNRENGKKKKRGRFINMRRAGETCKETVKKIPGRDRANRGNKKKGG